MKVIEGEKKDGQQPAIEQEGVQSASSIRDQIASTKQQPEDVDVTDGIIDRKTPEISKRMQEFHGINCKWDYRHDVLIMNMPLTLLSTNVSIVIELNNGKTVIFDEIECRLEIPGKFVRNCSSLSVKYDMDSYLGE